MPATSSSQVIAILGAYGGIGTALARQLTDRGYRLVLGGRDRDQLDSLAAEIGGIAVEVDGREFDQAQDFVSRAAEEGQLTGVVNCAGSVMLKPAHLTTRADYDATLDTNLTTAFALVRAAVKELRKEGGSIVLMSSAAANIGLANHEAIAAAKAGVAGLARSAAATYAGRNIRVNAVAPGLVATQATQRIVENEKALEASLRLHPLGRIAQPDQIANLIVWLLDSANDWMTGQVIQLDGGLSTLKVTR
jgi:NAD(P)-dependent dehydrogenase (short-subunit alcohol dehydrogenase family)